MQNKYGLLRANSIHNFTLFFIECETKTPFRVEFIWLDSTRVNVTLIVYMFVIHV